MHGVWHAAPLPVRIPLPFWQPVTCQASPPPAPQVLLKWNVQRGVAVIPKAGSEPHLRENIEGLFSWRLTWDQKVRGLVGVGRVRGAPLRPASAGMVGTRTWCALPLRMGMGEAGLCIDAARWPGPLAACDQRVIGFCFLSFVLRQCVCSSVCTVTASGGLPCCCASVCGSDCACALLTPPPLPTTHPPISTPPPPRCPQAKLDALDQGKHFVNNSWHTWEDPEEGGAAKPSVVLQ